MTATDVKIVTKQVVINKHYSSHLIPITGDEKCIDEIQEALNELDKLKRDVARYFGLEKRLKYINATKPYGIARVDMKQSYLETLKELNVLKDKLMKVGK